MSGSWAPKAAVTCARALPEGVFWSRKPPEARLPNTPAPQVAPTPTTTRAATTIAQRARTTSAPQRASMPALPGRSCETRSLFRSRRTGAQAGPPFADFPGRLATNPGVSGVYKIGDRVRSGHARRGWPDRGSSTGPLVDGHASAVAEGVDGGDLLRRQLEAEHVEVA